MVEHDVVKFCVLDILYWVAYFFMQIYLLMRIVFCCLISGWLKDDEDRLISLVSQRSKAIVNLTLDTVEELQVGAAGTVIQPVTDCFTGIVCAIVAITSSL